MAEAALNREPEISPAAAALWEWFWDLDQGRQVGQVGYLSLTAVELKAWEHMTGNIVRREEWRIIREMDRSYVSILNNRGADGQPIASSSNEMSVDAFDAVFG